MTLAELVSEVERWGGLRSTDEAALVLAAEAVLAWVAGLPVVADRPDPAAPWPSSVRLACVMLTARTYRRKDTPAGVIGVGEDGGVSFVPRYDPDVSRLLNLDGVQVG